MTHAKIICEAKPEIIKNFQDYSNNVSLRFVFLTPDGKDTVAFFVSSKVNTISAVEAKKSQLILVSLEYTQKAPDDLIEKLGFVLESNINATRRKSERLVLTDESIHKIDLVSREAFIFIQSIQRRCILIDISFSGVKLVLVGIANFLVGQEATVKFDFESPQTTIGVKGKIIRAEHIDGRKDLIAIAIGFHENEIPLIYKVHLNKFFSQHKIAVSTEKSNTQKSETTKPSVKSVGQES